MSQRSSIDRVLLDLSEEAGLYDVRWEEDYADLRLRIDASCIFCGRRMTSYVDMHFLRDSRYPEEGVLSHLIKSFESFDCCPTRVRRKMALDEIYPMAEPDRRLAYVQSRSVEVPFIGRKSKKIEDLRKGLRKMRL